MKSSKTPVHSAIICQPARMADTPRRRALVEIFGLLPVWVITVSQESWDYMSRAAKSVIAGFAVCKLASGGHNVVLVVQVDGLQLRSVVGLDNPLLQDFLVEARRSGVIRLAFGTDGGMPSEVFTCPVSSEEVRRLLSDYSAPLCGDIGRRMVELAVTAANCREPNELPSLFIDHEVRRADVSVITDETAMDEGDPAHGTGGTQEELFLEDEGSASAERLH